MDAHRAPSWPLELDAVAAHGLDSGLLHPESGDLLFKLQATLFVLLTGFAVSALAVRADHEVTDSESRSIGEPQNTVLVSSLKVGQRVSPPMPRLASQVVITVVFLVHKRERAMADAYAHLVGTEFPEFSLNNDEDRTVDRDSILGSWTVIFFYPKDGSPGCTVESCAFRDNYDRFERTGVTIYGVSTDSIESHRDFRSKHGLQYNLLSDCGGALVKALGLKKSLGFLRTRVTFVIDGKGIVRSTYTSQINMKGHVTEALRAIES